MCPPRRRASFPCATSDKKRSSGIVAAAEACLGCFGRTPPPRSAWVCANGSSRWRRAGTAAAGGTAKTVRADMGGGAATPTNIGAAAGDFDRMDMVSWRRPSDAGCDDDRASGGNFDGFPGGKPGILYLRALVSQSTWSNLGFVCARYCGNLPRGWSGFSDPSSDAAVDVSLWERSQDRRTLNNASQGIFCGEVHTTGRQSSLAGHWTSQGIIMCSRETSSALWPQAPRNLATKPCSRWLPPIAANIAYDGEEPAV
mmetsp:Transcript_80678/g.233330  ORF Transcript_80678/g.233330 Transcript_80678/m.233330 type:complete len:256 (-) Transcript_80678:30-797(-)